jgi:hypothetical protein
VGFGYAHPPPIEGIPRKLLNRRSLSGAEWERLWTLGKSLNSMRGGVRLRSPTPDRGHLKEIINRAFPERSRMGAPLESWRIFEFYGGGVRLRSPTPDQVTQNFISHRKFYTSNHQKLVNYQRCNRLEYLEENHQRQKLPLPL